MAEILLVDNMDSFTYNLVDELRVNNNLVIIFRNNISAHIILNKLSRMTNPVLVLSPGPGIPKSSGCLLELLKYVKGTGIPIIGICLGYQAIIEVYGGKLEYAIDIFHGKSSYIIHDNKAMYLNMENPLLVARYHSLICTQMPSELVINAKTVKDNIIMSFRHKKDRICGFQFHPESILTISGSKLLQNTIKWVFSKFM